MLFFEMMKKCTVMAILLGIVTLGFGQTDSTQPPYKRFPTIPPMKLLLPDSSTYFTKEDVSKKLPVLVIVFNPQCEHCRRETEGILGHIDQFKKIQIIMATMMSFDSMKVFYQQYKLNRFDNIVVGQDTNFMLPAFYNISNLPFLAFYNRRKELIGVADGGLEIPDILARFEK
jgi:thiol-disulfide isomerase/thioredoxin